MKKTLTITLLLLFGAASFVCAQKLNVPGFGEINYTRSGDRYTLDFRDYGKFDFSGSLNPLNLKSNTNIDQLAKFPGHDMLKRLGVKNVIIELSTKGFFIQSNVDPLGGLKTLSEFLQIDQPSIDVSARIAAKGIALRGDLSFPGGPMKIDLIPSLGTSIAFEKISIVTNIGIDYEFKRSDEEGFGFNIDFTPVMKLVTNMLIQPTKFDPQLKTVTEFAYNLVTQEISGAGSMVDTWINPMGMGELFDGKEALIISNAALSMGWIPGAPSPTKIGFFFEDISFFGLSFGAALDFSPTSGKAAFMGRFNKISLNELTRIIREAFDVDVPDIFPDDIYIENADVLFSPAGGTVGEFEIAQGFGMGGTMVFTDGFRGDLNFRASKERGVLLFVSMKPNLGEKIRNAVRNNSLLSPIVNNITNSFEMRHIELNLDAQRGGVLSGGTKVSAKVLNQDINFEFQGSFDPNRIVDELISRITEIGLANINLTEAAKKVLDAASQAGRNSVRIAQNAFATAQQLAEEASVAMNHVTHTADQCRNTCVPRYANAQTQALLQGSNEAVKAFRDNVIFELRDNVQGANEAETRRMRSDLIKAEWDRMLSTIDSNWDIVDQDRIVIRFFVMPERAADGRRHYRNLVNQERRKHIQYREQLWNEMMLILPPRTQDGERRRRP